MPGKYTDSPWLDRQLDYFLKKATTRLDEVPETGKPPIPWDETPAGRIAAYLGFAPPRGAQPVDDRPVPADDAMDAPRRSSWGLPSGMAEFIGLNRPSAKTMEYVQGRDSRGKEKTGEFVPGRDPVGEEMLLPIRPGQAVPREDAVDRVIRNSVPIVPGSMRDVTPGRQAAGPSPVDASLQTDRLAQAYLAMQPKMEWNGRTFTTRDVNRDNLARYLSGMPPTPNDHRLSVTQTQEISPQAIAAQLSGTLEPTPQQRAMAQELYLRYLAGLTGAQHQMIDQPALANRSLGIQEREADLKEQMFKDTKSLEAFLRNAYLGRIQAGAQDKDVIPSLRQARDLFYSIRDNQPGAGLPDRQPPPRTAPGNGNEPARSRDPLEPTEIERLFPELTAWLQEKTKDSKGVEKPRYDAATMAARMMRANPGAFESSPEALLKFLEDRFPTDEVKSLGSTGPWDKFSGTFTKTIPYVTPIAGIGGIPFPPIFPFALPGLLSKEGWDQAAYRDFGYPIPEASEGRHAIQKLYAKRKK